MVVDDVGLGVFEVELGAGVELERTTSDEPRILAYLLNGLTGVWWCMAVGMLPQGGLKVN